MGIAPLSSFCETLIEEMQFNDSVQGELRNCISLYSTTPETGLEILKMLTYRVIEAIKSFFGLSNWQSVRKLIAEAAEETNETVNANNVAERTLLLSLAANHMGNSNDLCERTAEILNISSPNILDSEKPLNYILRTIAQTPESKSIVRSCISKYSSFGETWRSSVKILVYKITEFIKSIFGASDWERAKEIIYQHNLHISPASEPSLLNKNAEALLTFALEAEKFNFLFTFFFESGEPDSSSISFEDFFS